MTTFLALLPISFLLLWPQFIFGGVREGKAVYETSELGMKLTEKALVNIEVKTVRVGERSQLNCAREALVFYQDQIGVYRLREGWFKLVQVTVIKKNNLEAIIRSGELRSTDDLVVHGADLLRVSEMDAFESEQ